MLHSWSWSWSSVPKFSVSYFVLQLQGEFSIVSRVVRSTDVDNVGEKVGKVGKISQVSRSRKSRKSCKSCENLIFAFRSSFKVKSRLLDVLGSFVTVNDVNDNDVEAKVCSKDKGKVAGTVATNDVKDVKDVKRGAQEAAKRWRNTLPRGCQAVAKRLPISCQEIAWPNGGL